MRAVPMHIREGSYPWARPASDRRQGRLSFGFPGCAAYILGISRAVGETMVVAIAAGMQPNLTWDPTQPAATITAYIVQVTWETCRTKHRVPDIFAAGLTLMLITLVFNIAGYVLRNVSGRHIDVADHQVKEIRGSFPAQTVGLYFRRGRAALPCLSAWWCSWHCLSSSSSTVCPFSYGLFHVLSVPRAEERASSQPGSAPSW